MYVLDTNVISELRQDKPTRSLDGHTWAANKSAILGAVMHFFESAFGSRCDDRSDGTLCAVRQLRSHAFRLMACSIAWRRIALMRVW